jgi:pimeloyl-ACP methyl ester carboxylesterase
MTGCTRNSATTARKGGFADKPIARFARALFPVFSKLAPGMASKVALRLFLSPPRFKRPGWERSFLDSAAKETLVSDGRLFRTYAWGAGPRTIVMCHSWGGRGSQLGSFIEPLTSAGFRVVAFDAPAHGDSVGHRTDMMEYSSAINVVVSHYGPVHGILGHSFGAGNSLFAWHRFRFNVGRMALIGCFSDATWVTERFGEILGIPQVILAGMRTRLEHRYDGELNWASLDIRTLAENFAGDLLFVHDRDDHEIPYFHAERLASAISRRGVSLLTTSGLGHRRIVRSQEVISRVADFFRTEV